MIKVIGKIDGQSTTGEGTTGQVPLIKVPLVKGPYPGKRFEYDITKTLINNNIKQKVIF